MTEQEFRKELDSFWGWVSKRERLPSSWYLSLLEWAEMGFARTYAADYPRREPAPGPQEGA